MPPSNNCRLIQAVDIRPVQDYKAVEKMIFQEDGSTERYNLVMDSGRQLAMTLSAAFIKSGGFIIKALGSSRLSSPKSLNTY